MIKLIMWLLLSRRVRLGYIALVSRRTLPSPSHKFANSGYYRTISIVCNIISFYVQQVSAYYISIDVLILRVQLIAASRMLASINLLKLCNPMSDIFYNFKKSGFFYWTDHRKLNFFIEVVSSCSSPDKQQINVNLYMIWYSIYDLIFSSSSNLESKFVL